MTEAPPEEPVRVVSPSTPFCGNRVGARIAPFAAGAFLAELSLLLPPGVRSAPAAYLSAALLVVTLAAILLVPWAHLPRRAAVIVPLAYGGSVLALALATDAASGLLVAVLIPLLWTALFHSKVESAVVVASVVVVEFAASAAQDALDAATLRRVVLWALLGAVVSISVHGLRDRVVAAHQRSEQLRKQLREVELNDDRLRIALELQDDVVRRIFAATLTLRAVPRLQTGEQTRAQLDKAVDELDEAVRLLRQTVFDVGTSRGRDSDPVGADRTHTDRTPTD